MEIALRLPTPDDWHVHLRDGASLATPLAHTAAQFARAVVMPNLVPPVRDLQGLRAYRQRIFAALAPEAHFQPLMTLYLTEATTPDDIDLAADSGEVFGFKLYPAGATTNSQAGVRDLFTMGPQLARLAARQLPLLIHGEVTDPSIDIFDRERVFLERTLGPLLDQLPDLRVVLEHITTAAAVRFLDSAGTGVAATITAHHLLATRNDMLVGAIRPHYYCLPILKRSTDREALLEAATRGPSRYMLGTDSAPHAQDRKECAAGCAGAYTAHAAIELYAEAFAAVGALDRLVDFACRNGPRFHKLPENPGELLITTEAWEPPRAYPFGDSEAASPLIPWRANQALRFKTQPRGAPVPGNG